MIQHIMKKQRMNEISDKKTLQFIKELFLIVSKVELALACPPSLFTYLPHQPLPIYIVLAP